MAGSPARFRAKPARTHALRPADPDRDDLHPGRFHDITVYDPVAEWRPTGLVTADGQPIERYVGLNPIGFLWDRTADTAR